MYIMVNVPFSVASNFPVNYFFDWNGNDIFKHKLTRKMRLVFATILLIMFITL